MEPKKNPAYDIHRHRNALFTIGLITSLVIVIMAFEWTTKIGRVTTCRFEPLPEEIVYLPPVTDYVYGSSQKPKPVAAINFAEVRNEELTNPSDDIVIEQPVTDIPVKFINPTIEMPADEPVSEPVVWAEVMPEPENCYDDFYEMLRKNLNYPLKARQRETEGKVFVQFVVNEQGDLSDLKIVKGIGSGCDEEAIRVLRLTKWKPGKQRGKPVKVRMTQPIYFKLGR